MVIQVGCFNLLIDPPILQDLKQNMKIMKKTSLLQPKYFVHADLSKKQIQFEKGKNTFVISYKSYRVNFIRLVFFIIEIPIPLEAVGSPMLLKFEKSNNLEW